MSIFSPSCNKIDSLQPNVNMTALPNKEINSDVSASSESLLNKSGLPTFKSYSSDYDSCSMDYFA
jgi:hypothetical protein